MPVMPNAEPPARTDVGNAPHGRQRTGARYLIVKLAALGDVVMASTMINAIRSRDAGAHITWLCGRGVAPLVRLFDGVDEVVVVDEVALLRSSAAARLRALLVLWGRLASRRFDVTLLAHADARYRAALAPIRLGEVRALEPRSAGRMLPIAGRSFADEYARLLDPPGSRGPIVGHAALARLREALPSPAGGNNVGVVLVPGGARNVLRESALRRWPVGRYRELAGRLLDLGHGVTLVGDEADSWVLPAFADIRIRDEIGAHDVAGTLAVLAHADLVITHDTGPLHLAGLARVPILGLFGPTMPSQFMPPDAAGEVLWGGAHLACRPCYDGLEFAACTDNLCMQDISVDEALARALAILGAPGRTGQPRASFRA